ncbi:MAG: PASTA domain-containing protein [Candidatus Hydrogenedentes bacterium]|nr:PASTA domain-containing protein [Candidatus Hydrogenedentota bacterium]
MEIKKFCFVLGVLIPLQFFTGYGEEKISYRLVIEVIGGGSVNPSPGEYYYPAGTTVFFNAIPNANWAFSHWEGSVSGTELYSQVYMDGHKTVTAVFVEPDWLLTISHSGDAPGITFPSPGIYGFLNGRTVVISSATTEGVYFGGWSGDAVGTEEVIQVYMDSDKAVNARFTSTGHILNVYIEGEGGATPGPLGNPHRYSSDVSVHVVTYQTNPLWRFHHWEGDIGENEPVSYILFNLLMNQDRVITAVFVEKGYYTLTMEIIGEGNVSLQKGFEEPIILPPGVHEFSFIEWSFIRCERIETTTGWKFLRWEGDFGDTLPSYPRASFSMDRDRYVRCVFTNQTQVPSVIGLTQTGANTRLGEFWLTVGEIMEVCSSEYPSGYVADQNPTAGTTVEIGTAVSLWVSTGPCSVPVPNVVGMSLEEADGVLTSAGLKLGSVTEQCDNQFPSGIVVGQSPEGGELLPEGSSVNVVVSSGACPVVVPNILWQTRTDAENMIISSGLAVGVVTEQCNDNVPAGRVMNQYPGAGQRVPRGSAVNINVSNGPCFVTVPNIVGYTRSLAQYILTNSSLSVGEISEQCHNSIRKGIVASQTPLAGERVPPGSAVNFVVSTGPCGEGILEGEGVNEGEGIAEGEGIIEGEGEGEGNTEGEGVIEGEEIIEGEGISEGGGDDEGITEGEGISEGEKPPHTADQDGDWKINLYELLRVIQLFNSGGYHCPLPNEESEDGYLPGFEGDKSCIPHSSDYSPQDWIITLEELLRLIQYFNSGGYSSCSSGEDGYCPGSRQ